MITFVKQCISAIAGDENNAVFVLQPVKSYTLQMIHVNLNHNKFCVNESVYDTACQVHVPENVTTLTGHGTGGAVALALALLLKIQHNRNVRVCTFGSPPIGDLAFNTLAAKLDVHRVKISSDPIATQGFGLEHCSHPIVVGNSFPSCVEKFVSKTMASFGIFSSAYNEAVYIQLLSKLHFDENDTVFVLPKIQELAEADDEMQAIDYDCEREWGILDPLFDSPDDDFV